MQLILCFQFVLITVGFNGIESLSVDYLLSDQENTFAVLVVPTGDSSNWTFCLFYDTYTEFDPAFPGILPIECDVKNNPFDAFTVISVNYTNRTANLSIYTAKIDVWYELAKNVSLSPEDAMVFDFKKSSGRGFVSLRDYSSKFKIPEFLKINNTVMLSTNGNGIRQITPSLSRIPTVQTTTTELPTPTELSTTEFPLIKTSTTEISIRNISVPAKNFSFESTTEFELPTTTTPSSFVQQLIEESQAILPSLKRSALFSSSTARLSTTFSSTASSSTTTASSTIFSTLLTPTTKQTSARKPKTTSIRAVRKNSPDHQLRTTPKPAVYTKPSTAAFDILHSNNTSSQSTSEFDVRAAISTQRSTAKEVNSSQTKPNERYLEIWDQLLKPKTGSKVEVIGKETDENELPELLMFKIPERLLTTRLPFPPFGAPPFVPPFAATPSTSAVNTTTQKPCTLFPHQPWEDAFESKFPFFGPSNPFPG